MTDTSDRVDGANVDPGLEALVMLAKRLVDIELRVHAPARVVAFDPATCKATVRIEMLPVNDVRGEDVPDIPITLPMIPVRYVRASLGGATIPLVPGDTGHVSFSDRALAAWLQNGNPVAPVDPESGRCHHLGDAFFEPGLMTDADAAAAGPIDMTATVIDGAALVKLGAAAVQFVALASLVEAQLNTLKAAIAAAPVTPLDGGAGFKAALVAALAAWPTTTAATKVQAQ